jgi:hypothetical protein
MRIGGFAIIASWASRVSEITRCRQPRGHVGIALAEIDFLFVVGEKN